MKKLFTIVEPSRMTLSGGFTGSYTSPASPAGTFTLAPTPGELSLLTTVSSVIRSFRRQIRI